MTSSTNILPKGFYIEELLRQYFLKLGYFVVRGVPFKYEGFDVTDIDLWLYSRTSPVSREITIVDSKNKKTPQAIERIFWTRGLQIAVNANNAIVATTDRRQEVKDFGKQLGVFVLDGAFLKKLSTVDSQDKMRITDEEFFRKINEHTLNKLDGDWKGRIQHSKGLLVKSLSFDSCNQWLLHGSFFAAQALLNGNHRETALRCLYLINSFLAIAIDFILKELSFFEPLERVKQITEGFMYGDRGSVGMKKILDVATGLIEQYANEGASTSRQVRNSVEKSLLDLNTDILGEFFSRNEVSRSLYHVAKEFESMAMSSQFTHISNASNETKSMLFCLLDYWGIERTSFLKF